MSTFNPVMLIGLLDKYLLTNETFLNDFGVNQFFQNIWIVGE